MARSAHRSTGGHVPWRTCSHTWEIRDVMREAELIPALSLLRALRLRSSLQSPATETFKSMRQGRQVCCSHGSMPERTNSLLPCNAKNWVAI